MLRAQARIVLFGGWAEEEIPEDVREIRVKEDVTEIRGKGDVGAYVDFNTREGEEVLMQTAISLVSIDQARINLETELIQPFGWDFNAVKENAGSVWNELLGKIEVKGGTETDKLKFYSNLYHSYVARTIWSDVNGKYRDPCEKIRTLDDPDSPMLGSDAFWNTFWNLNQFWNLVTPEWSNRWVKSQLAMYDSNGWLAKGPAGMEYVPVMVAEHEIPLIVGAYQMGIRDYDVAKAYEAVKKMQTTPGRVVGGGYAGNRDLVPYLKYKYVPYDRGRFSNTLEYSYDDWTVSQFARALGKDEDYEMFVERAYSIKLTPLFSFSHFLYFNFLLFYGKMKTSQFCRSMSSMALRFDAFNRFWVE